MTGAWKEGADACCVCMSTTWEECVRAGGAEGRRWREGEAWLKVVGGRAGGTDEVAQHPVLPAFQ